MLRKLTFKSLECWWSFSSKAWKVPFIFSESFLLQARKAWCWKYFFLSWDCFLSKVTSSYKNKHQCLNIRIKRKSFPAVGKASSSFHETRKLPSSSWKISIQKLSKLACRKCVSFFSEPWKTFLLCIVKLTIKIVTSFLSQVFEACFQKYKKLSFPYNDLECSLSNHG